MSNDISLDYKPGVDMNKKIFTNIVGSKSTHILLWTIDDYLVEDFFPRQSDNCHLVYLQAEAFALPLELVIHK